MSTPAPSTARIRANLGVLGAATFVGVSTELLPVGLLPTISADLSVSEAAAGLSVTGYALLVALSAAPLTAATTRWPRRRLLVTVLAVYALSTVLAALSPGLLTLLLARGLGGACHAVFWSMVAAYAARLVPAGQAGRASAAVFTGNALAVAVGLPLSTAVGQTLGWRTAFAGAAALALAIAALARLLLPPTPAPSTTSPTHGPRRPGSLRAALADPGVRAVVAVTGLVILGHYTFFSYISVYLRQVGLTGSGTSTALLVYGVAGVVGTIALGRAYDRRPRASFTTTTTTLLVALAALAVFAQLYPSPPVAIAATITIALLGASAISLPVTLQAMVLDRAGPAPEAASSLFVTAFNLGISGGGALGALLLTTTTSSSPLPLAAVIIATAGAALASRTLLTGTPTATTVGNAPPTQSRTAPTGMNHKR